MGPTDRIPGASLFGGQMPQGAEVRPAGPMGPPGAQGPMGPGEGGGEESDPFLDLIMMLQELPPEVLESLGLPPDIMGGIIERIVAKREGSQGPPLQGPGIGAPPGQVGSMPMESPGTPFKNMMQKKGKR